MVKFITKIKRNFSSNNYIIREVLGLFVALLAISLLLFIISDILFGNHNYSKLLMLLSIDASFVIVICKYKNFRSIQLFENFKIPDFGIIIYCIFIPILITILWPFLNIIDILKNLLNNDFQYSLALRKYQFGNINFLDIYDYLRTLLLMPVLEEVFYRRIIFERISTKYSIFLAVLLSSILFSLGHLNPDFFFTAFFIGLILGYSYYKTNNLFVPIIIHALINLSNDIFI